MPDMHILLWSMRMEYELPAYIPARQLKLVLAWNELHMDELMQNWELAKDDRPLNAIAPLM